MGPQHWRPRPGGVIVDRALGAYLGLALGDALGATVEFMTPREIALRFAAQGGVHRDIIGGGWLKLPPGQVTDDTTMSLALGDALLQGQRSGPALRHLPHRRGLCGLVARQAGGLRQHLPARHPALPARRQRWPGRSNDSDGGNGALMRNLPVVLATLGDDALFERVSPGAGACHAPPRLSDAAVLGIGRLLRAQLAGADRVRWPTWPTPGSRPPGLPFKPYPRRASGYVVDTVQTVLHCITMHEDFEAPCWPP
jgi:ADP-ribosyl-[dinitrogen reductase] hydrolase